LRQANLNRQGFDECRQKSSEAGFAGSGRATAALEFVADGNPRRFRCTAAARCDIQEDRSPSSEVKIARSAAIASDRVLLAGSALPVIAS